MIDLWQPRNLSFRLAKQFEAPLEYAAELKICVKDTGTLAEIMSKIAADTVVGAGRQASINKKLTESEYLPVYRPDVPFTVQETATFPGKRDGGRLVSLSHGLLPATTTGLPPAHR